MPNQVLSTFDKHWLTPAMPAFFCMSIFCPMSKNRMRMIDPVKFLDLFEKILQDKGDLKRSVRTRKFLARPANATNGLLSCSGAYCWTAFIERLSQNLYSRHRAGLHARECWFERAVPRMNFPARSFVKTIQSRFW